LEKKIKFRNFFFEDKIALKIFWCHITTHRGCNRLGKHSILRDRFFRPYHRHRADQNNLAPKEFGKHRKDHLRPKKIGFLNGVMFQILGQNNILHLISV